MSKYSRNSSTKSLGYVAGICGLIVMILLLVYLFVYIIKATNYSWFYEDMVKETITEMVKQEALK